MPDISPEPCALCGEPTSPVYLDIHNTAEWMKKYNVVQFRKIKTRLGKKVVCNLCVGALRESMK
jgi:hypothetical protein